ncbi:hypothetical protein B0H12DRAFT_1088360 [Mycena haematopus]|nr:hypothetical protein B0H12DRAFT_1088360 [Mycena haematopus]
MGFFNINSTEAKSIRPGIQRQVGHYPKPSRRCRDLRRCPRVSETLFGRLERLCSRVVGAFLDEVCTLQKPLFIFVTNKKKVKSTRLQLLPWPTLVIQPLELAFTVGTRRESEVEASRSSYQGFSQKFNDVWSEICQNKITVYTLSKLSKVLRLLLTPCAGHGIV